MKRNVTASKITAIRSPKPTKTHMRQFGSELVLMIERFHQRFVNGTLKALNKSTIEKFADAQTGNFAKIFLQFANDVTQKLTSQYSDDRIDRMVEEITNAIDFRNRAEIYAAIENAIGISSKELIATEGLTWTFNAFREETALWVKRLRDETLANWTANTLRMMAEGRDLDYIMAEVGVMAKERKSNAEMVARTQVASYNSYLTRERAQNLGITEAIWVTADDERVRRCHQVRDGKKFRLDEGLYSSCDGKTLLPGQDFSCRCSYKLLIPKE